MDTITHSTLATAVALILTGLLLRTLIAKRRFERRGVAGLQEYRGFWAALFIGAIEAVTGLAAILMLIAGLLLLLVAAFNSF